MRLMTKKMKNKAIATRRWVCPFCGSYFIEHFRTHETVKFVRVYTKCLDCYERWVREYRINSVNSTKEKALDE